MENLRKIWTIAYRELYSTFTQPSLIAIMFASPLILATIISLAFGGGGGSPTLENIPVAIVNLDQGANNLNNGQIFVNAFIPGATETSSLASTGPQTCVVAVSDSGSVQTSLFDLTDAVLLDDPAAARAGVDTGDYAAAIIIPADFSQSITYSQEHQEINPTPVEVYGDSGRTVTPGVIRSIVENITNRLLTGQIAVAATIDTMIARAQADPVFGLQFATAGTDFQPNFACAFTGVLNNIKIEQQSVAGEQVEFNVLVAIGSAQAVFFALFTANAGASSILEDRRNWTLQRMIVSPTPRVVILLGKLVGTFVTVLMQLFFLFIGFTIINSFLEGQVTFIWGTNWVATIVLLLTTALAASGVGMITAAIGKTAEQAQIVGSIISLLMGMLGGAFFQVQALGSLEFITRLSIVRWGSEAFSKLASGDGDIWVNVIFLALIGTVLFAISLWVFNRRQDI
jgi:ABC-2 type transport system permease protein